MDDPTGLSKYVDPKLVHKVYDDAGSAPAKEVGKLGTDVVKTFRLFLAPFQYAAAWQDRFEKWLERVRSSVPEERQVEAPASIAGPVIRSLVFMEDDNPLTELYLNLLARAIDKERQDEAHPAFVKIIEQLSPDEAMVMYVFRNRNIAVRAGGWTRREQVSKAFWKIGDIDFPTERLGNPEHLWVYLDHLWILGMVTAGQVRDERGQHVNLVSPTDFGKLFIKACIPEDLKLERGGDEGDSTQEVQ